MGVIDFYFVDNEVEDCCRRKVVDYAFDFSSSLPIIIGCIVTTQDFIKFWGKFFAFVLLEMIGISQGFKTF
jgi:hypothetical protein